ncbi:hypothetical protein HMI56_006514, partial [Coelomomyces lativittatus]
MQKFKLLYQNIWNDNKIDSYIKCLSSSRKKKFAVQNEKFFTSSQILKNLYDKLYLCLNFLDEDVLREERDTTCMNNFYFYLQKRRKEFLKKFSDCKVKLKIDLPLTSKAMFIEFSSFSWVIIMEWITTKRMKEENHSNLGYKFRLKYD